MNYCDGKLSIQTIDDLWSKRKIEYNDVDDVVEAEEDTS